MKKTSVLAAGAVLADFSAPHVHAAESNTIKIALIGSGSRGRGALIQALSAAGPAKLWAVADPFRDRVEAGVRAAEKEHADKVDVADRKFVGLDSFKYAIDSLDPGSAVLLATPPCFRPQHAEYAVEKGMHVFMEKSFAVDAPGARRTLAAGQKAAEKNLKIACGLNQRNFIRNEETIKAIHDGMIGDIVSCWVYRMHNSFSLSVPKNISPLQHQLRNFNCFTWTSGSYMLDWMIHNIDVSCWALGKWPVSCQGQGGRQIRKDKDQMYDHCAYEYRFDDGRQVLVQLRHMPNTWNAFRCVIHGTKGAALLGEGINDPVIYKGYAMRKDNVLWTPPSPWNDSYQEEHNRFFKAIREDSPCNETERGVKSCFAGIMGRMAVDSGQEIHFDAAWNSQYQLCPNLDTLTLDSESPLMPDENGNYALAVPGKTQEF